MKIRRLLFMLPILVLPIMGISELAISIDPVKLTVEQIGPYTKKCENQTLNYKITAVKSTKNRNIYEVFKFGTIETPNIYSTKTAVHVAPLSSATTLSVTMPTSTLLNENGMMVTISIYNSEDTLYIEKSFTIYPIPSETVDPTVVGSYQSKIISVKITSNKITNTSDSYTFTNIKSYFNNTIYYRLPIEEFLFTHVDAGELTYGNCYMSLIGYQRYFPALSHFLSTAKIPLKLVKKENGYGLDFANTLYVEKSTLKMTTSAREGYVATNNFYLPVNFRDELSDLKVYFVIEDLGISKLKMSWKTTCLMDNAFIGDCSDSEYCIVGGVKA